MDEDQQVQCSEDQTGGAIAISVLSWLVVHWTVMLTIGNLGDYWTETLLYPVIPLALVFIFLYRSIWHQEIVGVRRTLLLIPLAIAVYAGSTFYFGVILTFVCAVCARFTAWHY